MGFGPLLRMARGWLDSSGEQPPAELEAIVAKGASVSELVPPERRADWERLLGALRQTDDGPERTKARVASLLRACQLFTKRPPPRIEPLDPVDRLSGIGPSARAALAEHGIRTVADTVWIAPVAWDDMRQPMPLRVALSAARESYLATGGALRPPRVIVSAVVKTCGVLSIRGRSSVRAVLQDGDDDKCVMHAFWFFLAHGVLALAKPGTAVIVVGRIQAEPRKAARIAHPELFEDTPSARTVRARYARIGPPEATLRKAIAQAVASGITPDPVPTDVAAREKFPPVEDVLSGMHCIHEARTTATMQRAFVERLAWTEAFTRVWSRLASEASTAECTGPAMPERPDLTRALERELAFSLTNAQARAIEVIARDLASPRPMRRLLLGDVGTGKTAVALAAAAQCVAAGYQVAILAPTSVLAAQYVDAVKPLERALSARSALVAAGLPEVERRKTAEQIRTGAAKIIVGTHALLAEHIELPKLGLVVVDEQQRLGVAQRLSLVRKGHKPHLLTLSATPIPRTLALAMRGELAMTMLRERPAGRPPVTTLLAGANDMGGVIEKVEAACARFERVFWVVPRIEADPDEDEDEALATAIGRRAMLEQSLAKSARRVVLLHGGMSVTDKRDAMQAFRSGEAQVLVGTTVVEVGVDVPEATLMVVEDAAQFGLSQLHQLRGRVGRGERPGTCVLLHSAPLEGLAKARLEALSRLSTGEEIARADLQLRGAGDLSGTRQHGAEDDLHYLKDDADYPWLARIEEDARRIREVDPELSSGQYAVLGSLAARMGHAMSVREEAG